MAARPPKKLRDDAGSGRGWLTILSAVIVVIPVVAIVLDHEREGRSVAQRFLESLRAHDAARVEGLAVDPVRALARACATGTCLGDDKLADALRTLSTSHGAVLDGSTAGGWDSACFAGHLVDASDQRRELVVRVRKHMGAWRVHDVYLEGSNGRGCDF